MDYKKTVLDNGIRVVTERIPYLRSAAIGVWVAVGSRDETIENNGISHYIEHMMFKGTSTQSAYDIALSLESVGGHLNAFTSKELTCYYAHVLDEHIPKAISIIADILSNSLFAPEEMEKEKRVILEELSAVEETPEELIYDFFWEDLYQKHSLGLPIIGKREVISKLTRNELVEYLQDKYTGDKLVVAAAGNVEHDKIVNCIEDALSGFKNAAHRKYHPPKQTPRKKNIIENGSIQAHICVGTHAYKYDDKRKFDLLLLSTLLGAGMSSRLFQSIREKHGMAYAVFSFIDFMFDTGLFAVYLGTDKRNVDKSIELVLDELKRLCDTKVAEDELQRTKEQLKGNLTLSLEGASSRMNRLAKMEIYLNNHFSLDYTLSEIEKVTSEAILFTAQNLFSSNQFCTTVLQPKN